MNGDDINDPKVRALFNNHFKAGEYATLTIMVNLKNLDQFIEYLRDSKMPLVIMPDIAAELEYESDPEFDSDDTSGISN